ncbi:Peptidase M15 [Lysobacter sp. yr284]|uniref:D-Ala-D-Ala carboxypeptidase family metallohydrolase n=1 Tax=Lysobacter sp. yr284 TaxID=1761791 RepID=UPI00089790BE|nr:D-Ala-D-Ala carboxypeptidase family metallohydrolase [Lysobacter sp. yr284]SDY43898.1 Peptidase M15 [Lysobacter sp. yr284]
MRAPAGVSTLFKTGAAALLLAGCAADTPEQRFARWRGDGRDEAVRAYTDYLARQGVAAAAPLSQQLRSGRNWRGCGADEFALPPRASWPQSVASLRLLAELRAAGLIDGARIVSGYRAPDFNRCEGGSRQSRHMAGGAYDLELAADTDGARLCAFWRRRGPATGFGLGFYDRRRLHVDTAGLRTWGGDYTRKTSPCLRPAAVGAGPAAAL